MTETRVEFRPPIGLRSGHVQSLVASSALRRRMVERRARTLQDRSQVWTLDGGDGIRLQGLLSRQPQRGEDAGSKGLAVLLHGWEGSVNSNYVLANGARLYREGFDVFRLNFRDHGDTHHLNDGIFHSCRLDEVVNALRNLQDRLELERWFLAGYSLGGNFALRVGLRSGEAGLGIAHIVAVCPVINPLNALLSMEHGMHFYERYFERKWSRSLEAKRAAFPQLYGDEDWHNIRGLRRRTHYLATRHAGFDSAEEYFNGYSIAADRLLPLRVPATILTAADDPVVPVQDYYDLPEIPAVEMIISDHGGHCGFLKNWKFESMAEDLIAKRFLSAVENSG